MAYSSNRDSYGQTDVMNDPNWLIASIRGRNRNDPQRQKWEARLEQLQARPTAPASAAQPITQAPATPVDSALDTWDWRQAIDKPASAKQGDSKYDQQMGELDNLLQGVMHGDQTPGSGASPITSVDVMAAANSGAHAGASTDAASRYENTRAAYLSLENQASLGKLGGEAAYLTRVTNAANYPQTPDDYQQDNRDNYNTNVPGGSVQDALQKLAPGPGWAYNGSTGQWSAPGAARSVVRTEAGGPNRAGEFNYDRSVPVRPATSDVPPVSNPIPKGIDWPELPKTPGLPQIAGSDAASAINDRNQMINSLINDNDMPAPAPTPPPPTPTPPPEKKKEDEDRYA